MFFEQYFIGKNVTKYLIFHQHVFFNLKLTYFSFKSSEIKYYLKELDSNGGSDRDNMFYLFLKKTADLFSPKLAKPFLALLTSGSFPESWRIAYVSPIPKDSTPT